MIAYKFTESLDKGLTVSVFVNGRNYIFTPDSHLAFYELIDALKAYGAWVTDKVGDATRVYNQVLSFMRAEFLVQVTGITQRLELRDNEIYFGDEKLRGPLVDRVIRFYQKNLPYEYLFKFLENLMTNPDQRSKEQLYDFLERYDFPITPDGHFLAYKGLRPDGTSVHKGYGIVDGKVFEHDYLPNNIGSVVTMPRHKVNADPREGCSFGLHVGTLRYVKGFAKDKMVIVKVNPRDVVSVPADCDFQKVRTCKYEVVGEYTDEITEEVVTPEVNSTRNLIQDMVDDSVTNEYHLTNRAIKRLHPGASGKERQNYFDEYLVIAREVLGLDTDVEDEVSVKEDEPNGLIELIAVVEANSGVLFPADNLYHFTNRLMNLSLGKGKWRVGDVMYERMLALTTHLYEKLDLEDSESVWLSEWELVFPR